MELFYFLNDDTGRRKFIEFLSENYPQHMRSPDRRLIDIMKLFRTAGEVTVFVEPEYVDKQYRDSYYLYFARKYLELERNCVRLIYFEGHWTKGTYMRASISKLERKFIGVIVLRPLYLGVIGKTLLVPYKLRLTGQLQTCRFKSTVGGRRLEYHAFPFSSQDKETMTCAQTSLYNLISYYSRKYPEYRALMPNEILISQEHNSYERVLPANSMEDVYIAKALSEAHFYPRLYKGIKDFREILHIYVESGIPFLLGVPGHVVNCIGHGGLKMEDLSAHVKKREKIDWYYLSTSDITEQYTIMDDNDVPYRQISIEDLTHHYQNAQGNITTETTMDTDDVGNSMIVPLYRHVYIDAPNARNIVDTCFLENRSFIKILRAAYGDPDWGSSPTHPIVWRLFLTTSNNYRDFRVRKSASYKEAWYYMDHTFPHFIWVLEIGTIATLREGRFRAEIILDASSSVNSAHRAILSVVCKNHCLFFPDLIEIEPELREILKRDPIIGQQDFQDIFLLTMAMKILYNTSIDLFSESFESFSNLKEVANHAQTAPQAD